MYGRLGRTHVLRLCFDFGEFSARSNRYKSGNRTGDDGPPLCLAVSLRAKVRDQRNISRDLNLRRTRVTAVHGASAEREGERLKIPH